MAIESRRQCGQAHVTWPQSLQQQFELVRSTVGESTARILALEIDKQSRGREITDSRLELSAEAVHAMLIAGGAQIEIEVAFTREEAQQWRKPYP